jgi:uncharacterized membrane protein YphA (DoxX/SURF4 family)
MEKVAFAGRVFFAVALVGLGVEHFIFREFVTGRAPPWPEGVPGEAIWAFISGALIVLAGVLILIGRAVRLAALSVATLLFVWAVLRNIPVVIASDVLSQYWTFMVKALVLTGGSLAIATTFPKLAPRRDAFLSTVANRDDAFVQIARVCLAAFMINNGTQHLLFTDFVASLIPKGFPGNAYFWTYFATAALYAGALGMFYPRTARLAALLSGVMVFLWVWIVHVPRTFMSKSDKMAVFEALAVAGVALVMSVQLRGVLAKRDARETSVTPAS